MGGRPKIHYHMRKYPHESMAQFEWRISASGIERMRLDLNAWHKHKRLHRNKRKVTT